MLGKHASAELRPSCDCGLLEEFLTICSEGRNHVLIVLDHSSVKLCYRVQARKEPGVFHTRNRTGLLPNEPGKEQGWKGHWTLLLSYTV